MLFSLGEPPLPQKALPRSAKSKVAPLKKQRWAAFCMLTPAKSAKRAGAFGLWRVLSHQQKRPRPNNSQGS